MAFRDRRQAGRLLAERLTHLRGGRPVVVGLPRGGVPVAYEVARALDAPLDVILVRKLGVPFQPELGMGALGEDGIRVLNQDIMSMAGVDEGDLAAVEERERAELERRARRFRGERKPVALEGRTVVVVDDGIATGSTARAALQVVRAHGAARVVLAVPVAPPETVEALRDEADDVVCLETPSMFMAIGAWYVDFTQTPDDEVVRLLAEAQAEAQAEADHQEEQEAEASALPGGASGTRAGVDTEVTVAGPTGGLPGHLTIPEGAPAVVVFAHGSGSSRHSPRNRFVADILNAGGLGTLLFDLLSSEEEADRRNVFDIDLLAGRLVAATDWLREQTEVGDLRIGYFGASTGAAAALVAAAAPDGGVDAVVSRGGRPDLAGAHLGGVRAPTLLVVGGNDYGVIDLNREAEAELRCESRLEIVPGATHLFEEPGTLEAVAHLARDWFTAHLA